MQDRSPPTRQIFLLRTAGPYIWVSSREPEGKQRGPLYPQKRTWIGTVVVSALCQKQTFRRFFISSSYPAPHGIGE